MIEVKYHIQCENLIYINNDGLEKQYYNICSYYGGGYIQGGVLFKVGHEIKHST